MRICLHSLEFNVFSFQRHESFTINVRHFFMPRHVFVSSALSVTTWATFGVFTFQKCTKRKNIYIYVCIYTYTVHIHIYNVVLWRNQEMDSSLYFLNVYGLRCRLVTSHALLSPVDFGKQTVQDLMHEQTHLPHHKLVRRRCWPMLTRNLPGPPPPPCGTLGDFQFRLRTHNCALWRVNVYKVFPVVSPRRERVSSSLSTWNSVLQRLNDLNSNVSTETDERLMNMTF